MAVLLAFAKRLIALLSLPATIAILAWLFSPEARDNFVEIYAIAIFIAMLSRFGADQFLYKTISSEASDDADDFCYRKSTLQLSLLMALVGLLCWVLLTPNSTDWTIRLTVAVSVFALILLMDRATAFQMAGDTLWSSLSFPTFFLFLVLIVLAAGFTNNGAFTIASLVIAVFCAAFFIFQKRQSSARPIALPSLAQKLLPYAALGGNKAFFDWGVSVYLVTLLSPSALSIFVIANRLAAMLSIPASSLNAYLLREFSVNIRSGDVSANRKLMMQSIRLCLVTQVGIIAIYVAAFPLVAVIFKVDANSLAAVLIPLSIAQIVHGLTGPVGSMLLMSGHEKLVATISISVAVGSLISGYFATLWFGLLGLGIAIGGMLILQNLLYVFAMWRTERYLPFAGAMGLKKR